MMSKKSLACSRVRTEMTARMHFRSRFFSVRRHSPALGSRTPPPVSPLAADVPRRARAQSISRHLPAAAVGLMSQDRQDVITSERFVTGDPGPSGYHWDTGGTLP